MLPPFPLMNRKSATLIAVAALVALTIWLSRAGFSPPSNTPNPSESEPTSRPAGSSPSASATTAAAPLASPAATASPAAAALNAPGSHIHADLRALDEILATFRSNFPRTGNPVGANAEITAALAGKNKLGLALLPPAHPAINADGELCDRWGTPFFFHAESATRMTLRSAGPDRKMWNDDDVVFAP